MSPAYGWHERSSTLATGSSTEASLVSRACLLAGGWTVRRFTWDDLLSEELITVVRELLCG